MEYLEIVHQLEAEGAPLVPDSEEERQAIERFQGVLSDFKAADFRTRIRAVYAEDVFFNDTLKTVRGVEAVEEYLAASAEAIDLGTVEFLDLVSDNGNYYFRWVMTIRFKRWASRENTRSVGMTHIRFDSEGKVLLHQDFWDSAGGLFEHVPGLGWMLRRAKKQI
jgi:limonene-1,2-epoxide hydrolase